RHAGHHLGEEAYETGDDAAAAVLVDVDAAEDAEGDRQRGGSTGHEQRPGDRGTHAGADDPVGDRDRVGEEGPIQLVGAPLEHVDDDGDDRQQGDDEAPPDEERGHRVANLPGTRAGTALEDRAAVLDGDGAHATAPERRSKRAATPRAAMPTSTVNAK